MKKSFEEKFDCYSKEDGNAWGINWRSSYYKRMEDIIAIIRPFLKQQHLRVLEAGCATGDMTELILRNIKDLEVYDAFDISKKAVSICKGKGLNSKCHWFVGNLADLQLDRKYDFIICCDVICYLSAYHHKKCLDNFYEHLECGGRLFVCVPYDQKEVRRLEKARGRFVVEHKQMGFLWLWCKIEFAILKHYNKLNKRGAAKILRKVIANHKLAEYCVWINRKVFPNKYSHMYMLLKKE